MEVPQDGFALVSLLHSRIGFQLCRYRFIKIPSTDLSQEKTEITQVHETDCKKFLYVGNKPQSESCLLSTESEQMELEYINV